MRSRRPHVRAARAKLGQPLTSYSHLRIFNDRAEDAQTVEGHYFRAADGYPRQLRIIGVI
jgi:hypothetical protein